MGGGGGEGTKGGGHWFVTELHSLNRVHTALVDRGFY